MTKEFDYSPIDKILENHEKTAVIAILQDIFSIHSQASIQRKIFVFHISAFTALIWGNMQTFQACLLLVKI